MTYELFRKFRLVSSGGAVMAVLLIGAVLGLTGSLVLLADTLAPRAVIEQVTFLGSQRIRSDDGTLYSGPQWLDEDGDGTATQPGESHFPVWYAAGERPAVSVVLRLAEVVQGQSVTVVGRTEDGLEFRGKGWASGNAVLARELTANRKLPNCANYLPSYRIYWRVSWNDGRSFERAGTSEHRWYVTLGRGLDGVTYESVLDIGCRNAAGVRIASNVVARVWAEFSRRDASGQLPGIARKGVDGFNRADGQHMRFWLAEVDPLVDQVAPRQFTLAAMLRRSPSEPQLDGVGTCQAWAELLLAVCRAQGIPGADIVCVVPPSEYGRDANFLMRAREVSAQGNPTPPRLFFNHALVEYQGRFYDPSYGNGPFTGATEHAAITAWKQATVAKVLAAGKRS